MNRFINDKIGRTRRVSVKGKSSIDDLPLRSQLEVVLRKFEDPMAEVMSILDPFHDKIIRPEVETTLFDSTDPNKGLFRVIFGLERIQT